MRIVRILQVLAVASCCAAQTTTIPGSPITLSATSASGSSFVYPGVLTGNVTLTLTGSGQSCLQTAAYCTNAAGVVVVAGSSGVGQATTFSASYGGFSGTWEFGSLLMSIAGVGTVQVFPTNAANGLGSGTPPTSVTLSGQTLSSLGFGTFSVTNPTITFFVADNFYGDNTGSLAVSGSFTTSAATASVPALSDAGLVSLTLLLLAAASVMLRRGSAARI
jgi:hypothetical protein